MKELTIGKHEVKLYDAIDELPIVRFHRFNKMMLVDSGIGSDLTDVDKHLERIKAYIRTEQKGLAMSEIDNLRFNIYFIGENLCPKHLAFAALVAEVDGEPCDDLTDDGLKKTMGKLQDAPAMELGKKIAEVKKKIDDDLAQYYPQMQEDAEIKEYFNLLRKRTLAVLDGIISGDGNADELEQITTDLVLYNKPQLFSGADSVEVQYDKQFERMCHIISSQLHTDPKKYTVTEYYSAFDYIKEQLKSMKTTKK